MSTDHALMAIAGAAIMWLLNKWDAGRAKDLDKNTQAANLNTLAIARLEVAMKSVDEKLGLLFKIKDDVDAAHKKLRTLLGEEPR